MSTIFCRAFDTFVQTGNKFNRKSLKSTKKYHSKPVSSKFDSDCDHYGGTVKNKRARTLIMIIFGQKTLAWEVLSLTSGRT
jgi:hypothetical protein